MKSGRKYDCFLRTIFFTNLLIQLAYITTVFTLFMVCTLQGNCFSWFLLNICPYFFYNRQYCNLNSSSLQTAYRGTAFGQWLSLEWLKLAWTEIKNYCNGVSRACRKNHGEGENLLNLDLNLKQAVKNAFSIACSHTSAPLIIYTF
jgi:uncharacterized membrane protein